jgi:sugar lactone lactonase YvrE
MRYWLVFVLACGLHLLRAGSVGAAPIIPGDLFVADTVTVAVIRIDPRGFSQRIASAGGNFVTPVGIALEATGTILVADSGARAVIRVTPATGAQSVVSGGGNFLGPFGIALEPAGSILVADSGAQAVIRVDPATGAQAVVSSGGSLGTPRGIALEATGSILVADSGAQAVIRVDPATGAQVIVSSGGVFATPTGIGLDATGTIFVADLADQAVIRVHPATGQQTPVSVAGFFRGPALLAITPPRRAIVTAAGPGGGPHVRLLDAVTGGEIFSFFAYHPSFTGGVHVAVADVDGDGVPDVITGPGPGGGPHVRVFDGAGLIEGLDRQLLSFFAFDPTFTGGIVVGAADLNGDGKADIIVGAGPGGGPHVRIFDGGTGAPLVSPLASVFAFSPAFGGGVFVAGFR